MLPSPFCGSEDFHLPDFGCHRNLISLSSSHFTSSVSLFYHLSYTLSIPSNGISNCVHLLVCSDTPVCLLNSPLHSVLWCILNCNVPYVEPQILILQGASRCLRLCIANGLPKDGNATGVPLTDQTFWLLLWKANCHTPILVRVKYSDQGRENWTKFLRAVKGYSNMKVSIKFSMLTSLFQPSAEAPAGARICFSTLKKIISLITTGNLSWCSQLGVVGRLELNKWPIITGFWNVKKIYY